MPMEYRPDNDVIDDDARLDSWYETFIRDMAHKAGHKGDRRFALTGDDGKFQVPDFGVEGGR